MEEERSWRVGRRKKAKSGVGEEVFIFFPMGGKRATKPIRELANASADFPRKVRSFPGLL